MQLSTPVAARVRPLAAALIVAGATLALALTLPTAGEAGKGNKPKTEDVRVMARNLYLGADLEPALDANSVPELQREAADILAEVQRTDFPARARLLAREINRSKPDLVGLQEVALWRVDIDDPDGDLGPSTQTTTGPLAPNSTPAETVLYDFLEILKQRLKAIGARYRVVHVQQEVDAEIFVEERERDPHPDPSDPDYDGRLTMRDVILAKRGDGVQVEKAKAKGAHFKTLHEERLEACACDLPVDRGWQSVPANVRGERFLFVNTHLEAFDEGDVRAAQARELVNGPAKSKKDVVLLGDFNTGNLKRHNIGTRQEGGTAGDAQDRRAWSVITKAGFFERQTKAFSCCYDAALDQTAGEFDHTVDHITVNNKKIGLGRSFITGDERRTAGGLWPSDHGGVFSVLEFPAGR